MYKRLMTAGAKTSEWSRLTVLPLSLGLVTTRPNHATGTAPWAPPVIPVMDASHSGLQTCFETISILMKAGRYAPSWSLCEIKF
jgi:hypothetical protein